jgi:ribosomal protein L5
MRRKMQKYQSSLDELSIIAGQRGVLTRSKAIAAFKLRENTSRNLCYITWKTNVCF